MKKNTTETPESGTESKGFFKRIFTKIDTVMKEKADQQAGSCCCCESETEKTTEKCCGESDTEKKADRKCC